MMKPIPALAPLGWLYESGMRLRNIFFDRGVFRSVAVKVPVISVGNMTAGGTGKTPITDLIVRQLLEKGKRVAVVSRGYGRKSSGTIVVSNGKQITATAEQSGDEPMLLARRNPAVIVIVDERRVRGGAFAVEEFGAEVIVLDDGFQHRALRRDVDIVLVDAAHPPFDMAVLPAGARREPLNALRRASAVIVTKADALPDTVPLVRAIRRYTAAPVLMSTYRPLAFRRAKTGFSINMQSVTGKSAVAFCGIARPESFRAALESLGVRIDAFFAFDDHHVYAAAELQIVAEALTKNNASYIVTTEKDVARCLEGAGRELIEKEPVFFLEMQVSIDQHEAWESMIQQVA
ncbi:MAG: tetraacyldisaccharide 4'-kinase [Ignavibacteriales bacterium]|nr:tetraacyldisaccharide 4'-kinase [Ignavibacteriales bacterium]